MEIAPLLDWSFVQSLALGGIVGLERQSHYDPSHGTEPIGVRTFSLASLLGTISVLAAVAGVLVVGVLSVKEWTHRLVENLSDEEVEGTVKFLLISVVVLPILPAEPVDPWGIYHPQEIWFLVVLISGISFVGYFAIPFFGRDRGIALTGALGAMAVPGGIVSSLF